MTPNDLATTKFSTPTDLTIVATRTFNAPRAVVFAAWSDPKHIPNWMLGPDGWTMPVCEVDLRVGGTWHFVWRRKDGTEMEMHGVYREITPPSRLVTTESWGGPWPETVNTVELREENGRTLMTHTMSFPSRDARDKAMGTGMESGMGTSMARLEAYLATLV